MTSQQIRQTFFDFFKSKEHQIVPSAPMVVKNDPTLMFTNAGMNQFKDYFFGNATPPHPRLADTQKCLRVSGKHNDLEEVGHDTYHHTMFEMLGNWSFGDYFKKEAINWAWELLTEWYKIDANRLYATVFEGDSASGVERDNEAFDLWKKHLPAERIILGNKKDNFWEMGDTGPCGPCTEVHVDLRSDAERKKTDGATLVNAGTPDVIEIWNLVFIQFNRKANGALEPLPAKHVDTGMGFERLCMLLQGKRSNYDTDVFQPLLQHLARLSGKPYGSNPQSDIAMRVMADHLRAVCFAIADGQLPGNAKAGYVIRRILRRAVRYGYTFLDFTQPTLCQLVSTLVEQMSDIFPEIKAQQTLIENVIREEETAFLKTLEVGIKLLEAEIEKLQAQRKKEIDGNTAFVLYDTYGFPYDLTELIAREKGFTVDEKEFLKALNQQKERSRNAAEVETGDWTTPQPPKGGLSNAQTSHSTNGQPCEVALPPSGGGGVFVGYDTLTAATHITRYRKVNSKGKERYQIVLAETPFYGEMGGQAGDTGVLVVDGQAIKVVATQKENALTIHITEQLPANVQAQVQAKVDAHSRLLTANHHSATHLLHFALRKILGAHVEQKGSMVSAEGLRFDFSHFQKVSEQELEQVERLVNSLIRANASLIDRRNVPIDEARKLGAMALFGEKYGDSVRVVTFGESVELCGGTHAAATGQIGFFKIISEAAISAGVRRIEAVTGEKAEDLLYAGQHVLTEIKQVFSTGDVGAAVRKTVMENADLHKKVEGYLKEKIALFKDVLLQRAKVIEGIKYIELVKSKDFSDTQYTEFVENLSADVVKELAFQLRATGEDLVFVAATALNQKPTLTLMLSDSIVKQGLNASNIIRQAAKEIGGSGGGQPFLATAGGKNAEGLAAAVSKIQHLIFEK
ncbi:alanine--tRNA ligase [Bacteroidia bacterium]|nr:alanine--tRNA ligase [Bacteroidia bacterium]